MKRWMLTLSFKEPPTPEVIALIPAEQARVREMLAEGSLETLYIAADNSHVWLVMKGDTAEDVKAAYATLPMHAFFDPQLTPLN